MARLAILRGRAPVHSLADECESFEESTFVAVAGPNALVPHSILYS